MVANVLKQERYYTDDEASYAKSMKKQKEKIDKELGPIK